MDWDVFISHAWEDKESFARPLARALEAKGLHVWFDEFTMSVGDSLRRSIDRGLANSRYGVVILSPSFFTKEWPQKELDGLAAKEVSGDKVILPVWHNITAEEIRKYSPLLADRIGVKSDYGIEHVVTELLRAMQSTTQRVYPEKRIIKDVPLKLKETTKTPSWANTSTIITLVGLAVAICSCMAAWLALPQIQSLFATSAESTRVALTPLTNTALTPATNSIPWTWTPAVIPTTPRPLTATYTPTFTPFTPTLTPSRTPTLGPPTKGKIAFHSTRDGQREIYVMNADGSQQKALTTRSQEENSSPDWSPDGTRIAFNSNRDGNQEIYVMNADGTNQTNLTHYTDDDVDPAWSRDGKQIAFVSNRDGNDEIYIMNSDGSNQRRLTKNPAHDWRPSWSPDGTLIAFMSDRTGIWQIYTINVQTLVERNLSNNGFDDSSPSWSPNGKFIAFSSGRAGSDSGTHQIYIMDPDGSNRRKPTGDPSMLGELPSWSPDELFLAYESYRDGKWEVYRIDLGNLTETRLTSTVGNNAHPTWSPQ